MNTSVVRCMFANLSTLKLFTAPVSFKPRLSPAFARWKAFFMLHTRVKQILCKRANTIAHWGNIDELPFFKLWWLKGANKSLQSQRFHFGKFENSFCVSGIYIVIHFVFKKLDTNFDFEFFFFNVTQLAYSTTWNHGTECT